MHSHGTGQKIIQYEGYLSNALIAARTAPPKGDRAGGGLVSWKKGSDFIGVDCPHRVHTKSTPVNSRRVWTPHLRTNAGVDFILGP